MLPKDLQFTVRDRAHRNPDKTAKRSRDNWQEAQRRQTLAHEPVK